MLGELRSARRAIEAQQRNLAQQADRVDELIARAEAGESLSPTPTVLARFHDDLETRVRALGGDDLPGRPVGRAMWGLSHVPSLSGYPHPAQRSFTARLLELMLADPDFAATIRRSAGEENPVL